MIQSIIPIKAQFTMDEGLKIKVCVSPDFSSNDKVKVQFYNLGKLCFEDEKQVEETLCFEYNPPHNSKAMEGFWIKAVQLNNSAVISKMVTACDRALSWNYTPRYGFLSDFSKEDLSDESDVQQLNTYHLNVIQFYDWMYRHDNLFSPQNDFKDIMGKASSMDTVKRKVELLHKYSIKAIAYGAVYAAEDKYFEKHKNYALYDEKQEPLIFIDKIYYMDINRECEWHNHIISEYKKAIQFGFDGIHMDQYGFPKEAYSNNNGKFTLRKLRDDFPNLINDTKSAIPESGVIFNAVNNWPIDTVAKSNQDCVYIEVWSPNDTYYDLNRLVSDAKKYAPDKQVILAAYLHPFAECDKPENIMSTAFLAMSTIFSSGGFHLLLGENNGMLTQAYYSDYCHIKNQKFISKLHSYYDFITAYEELLFDLSLVDDTRTYTGGVNDEFIFSGADFSTIPEKDHVWTQIKHTDKYKVIQLVNYTGIENMNWNDSHTELPKTVKDINVNAMVSEKVKSVYFMSPDTNNGECQKLNFKNTIRDNRRKAIEFTVPQLDIWDVIAIELVTE